MLLWLLDHHHALIYCCQSYLCLMLFHFPQIQNHGWAKGNNQMTLRRISRRPALDRVVREDFFEEVTFDLISEGWDEEVAIQRA